MKKFLFAVLLIFILALSSCSIKNVEPKKENIESSDTSYSESKQEKTEELSSEELKELFDRNLECTLHIFDLQTLPFDEENAVGTLCPVISEKFKTFDDLKAYVNSTYKKETADKLLFGERLEGHTLYSEKDGVFYIDTYVIGGKGYYVSWNGYKLEIKNATADKCDFTATASIEEPSDNPKKEPYIVDGTAVKVDGKWVLERMYY